MTKMTPFKELQIRLKKSLEEIALAESAQVVYESCDRPS